MTAGLGEFGRIQRFFAPLAAVAPGAFGLTDDAALVSADLVVTADAMVEGVHFLGSDPPDLVARKLLRVNLSDLAAMGAVPQSYVMTMALPARCDDAWVERFCEGLGADQAAYGVHLLGGDSVSTPGPVTLSLTAFGRLTDGRPVPRSGARAGDVVFVSGTIGDGALGLLVATARLNMLDPRHQTHLRDRYQLPQPRVGLGHRLAGVAHAMMDVSDGLIGDLDHICAASGVGAIVEAGKVPLSDAAADCLADDLGLFETVLTGGDDYELLFTAPESAEPEVARRAAEAEVAVTAIGRIVEEGGVRTLDRDGAEMSFARTGFRHG